MAAIKYIPQVGKNSAYIHYRHGSRASILVILMGLFKVTEFLEENGKR